LDRGLDVGVDEDRDKATVQIWRPTLARERRVALMRRMVWRPCHRKFVASIAL
jgi:hypothetical protein